ncbi:Ent-kaur-16-ene synthase- chloroplastic [Striga hermonthica]|uniref:Ent-kaur-16-ene synthase- chloroplastic n=1 Tax=Striga hermonthica TaxID=68872 RepID=A0A9N7N1D2_STRHE|nr:Ent-kaur-16-ene synthase- chloroplastic [Striga hermonthica]
MYLHQCIPQFFTRNESRFNISCSSSHLAASSDTGVEGITSAKFVSTGLEDAKERISKLIQKAELSISTYDTAWVAMVPSPNSFQEPCFPGCLEWLLENQCPDGSWARSHHHPLLKKDVLSSTLACLLALRRWGVGEEQIKKGTHYIETNFASAVDEYQIDPLGFIVIFPAMLDYARDLLLELRVEETTLTDLIRKSDRELKRCYKSRSVEEEAFLAYTAERIRKSPNWTTSIMKYQRKNGSLFNSPSTTAAAYIGLQNSDCLNYLHSAVKKFGSAVPAVYPLDLYSRLSTVDNLENLGISRYFPEEIKVLLDETYRCWVQGDEEIFLDASTCALAFQLLRMNGYIVNSERLTGIIEECLSSSFRGSMIDVHTTLELYRASQVILSTDEGDLEKLNLRLKHYLEQKLSHGLTYSSQLGRNIEQEVKHALQYPFYAIMERVATRRNIECYTSNSTRILKTSYCSPNLGNKDFLLLSVTDFNRCQAIHRDELKELERWVVENRLDELKFARSKSAYCYFSAASTIWAPEQSDARLSWAQNAVLTTVVDDFFDVGGSIEELKDLIHLVRLWDDADVTTQCFSKNVKIIFSALRRTISEIGEKGFIRQGRNVTNHIINIWLDLLNSMMKEAEWARDNYLPTMDEYMSNAYVSFALGPIVLPALYLVGPTLSEEMVQNPEFHNLYKLMSTCGRLLNDIQTCERELKDGKLNAVPLYMINSGGKISKEAAVMEMKRMIVSRRRELLSLVLEEKCSVIPKSCKALFWHMSTVLHLFYVKDDGFTSQELIKVVNQMIYEPIVLSE